MLCGGPHTLSQGAAALPYLAGPREGRRAPPGREPCHPACALHGPCDEHSRGPVSHAVGLVGPRRPANHPASVLLRRPGTHVSQLWPWAAPSPCPHGSPLSSALSLRPAFGGPWMACVASQSLGLSTVLTTALTSPYRCAPGPPPLLGAPSCCDSTCHGC